MNVEEMIKLLRKFPPEQEVYVSIHNINYKRYDETRPVIGVSHDDPVNGVVFIDVL